MTGNRGNKNMENTTLFNMNMNNSTVLLTEKETLDWLKLLDDYPDNNNTIPAMFPTGDELSNWMKEGETSKFIPIVIFRCMIVLTGIIGNAHVCYIYWLKRDMPVVKLFVFSIGVFDLISSGIIVPAEMVLDALQIEREVKCILAVSLTSFMSTCLVAVTVERYNAVFKPKCWQKNFRRALCTCFLIMICCEMAAMIVVLIIVGISSPTNDVLTLEFALPKSDDSITSYDYWYSIFGLVLFIAGLFMMVVMDIMIVIELFEQSREAGRIYEDEILETSFLGTIMERSRESIILNMKARKETISMIIVSAVFFISCAPTFVAIFIDIEDKNYWSKITQEEMIVGLFFQEFFKLNYVIKPAIYLKYDSHFRKECLRILPGILSCCVRKVRGHDG